MPLDIRPAEASDAAALALVAAATFALACPDHTTAAGIRSFISSMLSIQKFVEYLADENRMIFLASDNGLPLGYTMVVFGEPTDADVRAAVTLTPVAELSKCYVLAGHHGSGIAAALVDLSVSAARSRGAAGMWLGVNNENARANRFYEKNGFEVVGTKKFNVGTELENDFVRQRAL